MNASSRILSEIEEIGFKLERHHGVFYQLWLVSNIIVDDKCPTAAVRWNSKTKRIDLLIGPKFWDSLNAETKRFVIGHELLHLVLSHPMRTKAFKINPMVANIAQDVCVNEMLVRNFGFQREKLTNGEMFCWLDTVPFTDKNIQPRREFEYYYNRVDLPKNKQNTVDDHGQWGQSGDPSKGSGQMSEKDAADLEEAVKEALEGMDVEELEDLADRLNKNGQQAGTGTMGQIVKVKKNIRLSQKWRKIYKNWSKPSELPADDWTRQNRRLSWLKESNFMLPTEHENEQKLEKEDVWLFLDTSGSCATLAQDFFDAANTIPKKWFNVTLFCFDTNVYKVKNNQLEGFGGTAFTCIENYIISQKCTYPKAVFVITDGYGDNVRPKFPDRWYWFLSKSSTQTCIPRESKVFDITDLKPLR